MHNKSVEEANERTVRPWGWYEAVSEVVGYKIKRIGVLPGQQLSLQKHVHLCCFLLEIIKIVPLKISMFSHILFIRHYSSK